MNQIGIVNNTIKETINLYFRRNGNNNNLFTINDKLLLETL